MEVHRRLDTKIVGGGRAESRPENDTNPRVWTVEGLRQVGDSGKGVTVDLCV